MKARIIISLLLTIALSATAQETIPQDTALYIHGRKVTVRQQNDKIKVSIFESRPSGDTIQLQQVFEGLYLNGRSIERTTTVSIPLVTKSRKYRFDPHYPAVFLGFTKLAGGVLRYSAAGDIPQIAGKSKEWGINFCNGGIAISSDNHWGITSAIGIARTEYKLDNNYGFERVDGITVCQPAAEGRVYQKSWLRYWSWRIPVSIEWQTKFGSERVFITAGPEFEWRMGITSRAKYDNKKHTLTGNPNVNPIGLNLLMQAGYGCLGFHARLALTPLFEKEKGPDAYSASVGVGLYW
ncbi:MAG: hypothetical protein LBN06_01370 [Prevotellaceae bacterium]|jgi:hypothetical protein|nr:hypothetical protein [Prevotellaceae bacterium]